MEWDKDKQRFYSMQAKKCFLHTFVVTTLTIMFYLCYPKVTWRWTRQSQDWQDIQQERRKRVEKICSKYPQLKVQEIDYRRFKISEEYGLYFCSNAKVGSTTYLRTTFTQILRREDSKG